MVFQGIEADTLAEVRVLKHWTCSPRLYFSWKILVRYSTIQASILLIFCDSSECLQDMSPSGPQMTPEARVFGTMSSGSRRTALEPQHTGHAWVLCKPEVERCWIQKPSRRTAPCLLSVKKRHLPRNVLSFLPFLTVFFPREKWLEAELVVLTQILPPSSWKIVSQRIPKGNAAWVRILPENNRKTCKHCTCTQESQVQVSVQP